MSKLNKFIAIFLLVGGTAEAVLPPFYSTVAEYKALLEDKQLEEKLGSGQAILSIERINDGFRILTPKYTLKVDVVYDPMQHVGPAKFHFIFHDADLR